ncbi:hypothetical protein ARMGADRAFT_554285 [Armillaria gallica]|uniref:Uncharacterized protein n=1 Tax=Armillaria gallica TaxID=47427 RepID=A0A2H3CRR9_ARMGA|nr:hypothetical protein ARMGADRAFT_554285 [Armillaria gallica]
MEIEPSRMRTVFLDHYRFAPIWPHQTHTKLMVVDVRPVPARGSRNCDFVRICAFLLSMMLKKGNSMDETRSLSYTWCMYAALLQYCQRYPYRHNNRLSQVHKTERSSLSVVLTFSSNLYASWKPLHRIAAASHKHAYSLKVRVQSINLASLAAIRAPSIRRH